MNHEYTQNLGVIEGFFGRSWSFDDRIAMVTFLKSCGFNFYIYAPKSDPFLRRKWQEDWPEDDYTKLIGLANHSRISGLDFGIGLSPFELYRELDGSGLKTLEKKVIELNRINADIFCILFDDMRGDMANLAKRQVQIVHFAAEVSSADRIIMCPTYYSNDPVLDRVFGKRPPDYLMELGDSLNPDIDVFWTGPHVCSEEYPSSHLIDIAEILQRKPVLWDNYPVNDGAKKSEFLHLMPFKNRSGQLSDLTRGHAVNPMNQPWLSQIPLYTLPKLYQKKPSILPEALLGQACKAVCTEMTGHHILNDIELLNHRGLSNITLEEKQVLTRKYSEIENCPFSNEIVDWLNGNYAFDPSCLTD